MPDDTSKRCAVENKDCMWGVYPHHVKTRGAGGKDENNKVYLCNWHHTEVDNMGTVSFYKKYLDIMAEYAKKIWGDYLRFRGKIE